jgi:hypothetical protein
LNLSFLFTHFFYPSIICFVHPPPLQQIDCSSSLFEFTNHFVLLPHQKTIVAIVVQPRKERRSNGGTTGISRGEGGGGRVNTTMTVFSSDTGSTKRHIIATRTGHQWQQWQRW